MTDVRERLAEESAKLALAAHAPASLIAGPLEAMAEAEREIRMLRGQLAYYSPPAHSGMHDPRARLVFAVVRRNAKPGDPTVAVNPGELAVIELPPNVLLDARDATRLGLLIEAAECVGEEWGQGRIKREQLDALEVATRPTVMPIPVGMTAPADIMPPAVDENASLRAEVARMRRVVNIASRWSTRPLSVTNGWMLGDIEMFRSLRAAVGDMNGAVTEVAE